MGHTRIQTATLALLFIAGIGDVAVHASPTCQRLVKTYVTVPIRNRVSKATELAWAKWRVGHPGWRPKPGVVRPKYRLSRKEAIDKVNFACEVPPTPDTTEKFFTPADFEAPPAVGIPPVETSEVTYPGYLPPVQLATPPMVATDIPGPPSIFIPASPVSSGIFIPPFVPPPLGGTSVGSSSGTQPPDVPPVVPIAPITVLTPEPSSLILVALGMGGGLFLAKWRFAH